MVRSLKADHARHVVPGIVAYLPVRRNTPMAEILRLPAAGFAVD